MTISPKPLMYFFIAVLIALLEIPAGQAAGDLNAAIRDLQHGWAQINYKAAKSEKVSRFGELASQAAAVHDQYPDRAEPLVWEAIILSTEAGAKGGFGALKLVKKARKLLLAAEKIDPNTLNGSIYTSLGSLYYQVPGWPIGFGDKKKAERYLKKALEINPNGIDPNYFYADYLYRQKHYAQAAEYAQKALQAPARPDRPVADAGRRQEAQSLLDKIHQKRSQLEWAPTRHIA